MSRRPVEFNPDTLREAFLAECRVLVVTPDVIRTTHILSSVREGQDAGSPVSAGFIYGRYGRMPNFLREAIGLKPHLVKDTGATNLCELSPDTPRVLVDQVVAGIGKEALIEAIFSDRSPEERAALQQLAQAPPTAPKE